MEQRFCIPGVNKLKAHLYSVNSAAKEITLEFSTKLSILCDVNINSSCKVKNENILVTRNNVARHQNNLSQGTTQRKPSPGLPLRWDVSRQYWQRHSHVTCRCRKGYTNASPRPAQIFSSPHVSATLAWTANWNFKKERAPQVPQSLDTTQL